MTVTDVSPGECFKIRVRGRTISHAGDFDQEVRVMWVENGHVHYTLDGCSLVCQTPIDRFLEILNDQPGRWH